MSHGWHQLQKHAGTLHFTSPVVQSTGGVSSSPEHTSVDHAESAQLSQTRLWNHLFPPKWSRFKSTFSPPSVGALQLACTLTVFMLPIFSFSSNVSSSLSFVVNKISRHAGFWKQTRQSGKMKTTITATGVPQRRRSDAFPLPAYLRMSQLIEWKWRAGAIADLL